MAIGKYKEWLEEDNLLLIAAWARDGLTNEQIAHNMGIRRETLTQWCKAYPNIDNALKKKKAIVDIEVENELNKKTKSQIIPLKKTFKIKHTEYNEKGYKCKEWEELVIGYDEVYIPADTTAQIFWLKNRKPAEWRDKREVDMGDNSKEAINNFIKAVSPTEEELKAVFDNEEE